jgi:hypothetical protein
MTLLDICQWLEQTRLATAIQESQYGFPLVVAVHILGLALSVGTLLWVDLRMLGVALRQTSVTHVYRSLAPWFSAGFVLMLASGATLFTAFATSAYANGFFRFKMVAIVLAGANAIVFHFLTERASRSSGGESDPPTTVRAAGLISIVLWTAVILAGRMMSYTMFSAPSAP